MAQEDWLTVDEVAHRLGLKRAETVRRWLRAGNLRGTLISDRMGWRVRAADLERFIAARTHGGEADADVGGEADAAA
jgi:excisionase family DNA binding protein